MKHWTSLAPVIVLMAGACVASKGDIALLQNELRATAARSDSAAARAEAAHRAQMEEARAAIAQAADSLRVLSNRVGAFQTRTGAELDEIARNLIQVQAQLGQSVRSVQEMRATWESLRDQQPPAAPVPGDTSHAAAPGAGAAPGPTTMFVEGRRLLEGGSYRTARMNFEQLLQTYPNFEQASLVQLYIADAYVGERNPTAADSVYQLVVKQYPKSAEAPTALYRRALILWNADKKQEARPLLRRLIRDYPGSDAASLAQGLLDRK